VNNSIAATCKQFRWEKLNLRDSEARMWWPLKMNEKREHLTLRDAHKNKY